MMNEQQAESEELSVILAIASGASFNELRGRGLTEHGWQHAVNMVRPFDYDRPMWQFLV